MRRSEDMGMLALLITVLATVAVYLAFPLVCLYVAWHFISKFW